MATPAEHLDPAPPTTEGEMAEVITLPVQRQAYYKIVCLEQEVDQYKLDALRKEFSKLATAQDVPGITLDFRYDQSLEGTALKEMRHFYEIAKLAGKEVRLSLERKRLDASNPRHRRLVESLKIMGFHRLFEIQGIPPEASFADSLQYPVEPRHLPLQ